MKTVIALLGVIWFCGCVTTSVVTVTSPEKQFQDAAVAVKEKRYKDASAAYTKIMAEAPDSTLAADSQFALALVTVNHDNPQRDYSQASRTFSEFIKRYPNHPKVSEAQSWLALLKAVQELKKQNEYLGKSIEELKRLDIRHEEKRRK